MVKLIEIENAILAAINLGYLRTGPRTVSARDLREGEIVAVPPAVLVMYLGAELTPVDVRGLNYVYNPRFLVLVAAKNFRGLAEEKKGGLAGEVGVYNMLDDLRAALGGKKLTFTSGGGALLILRNEAAEQVTAEGTVFSLEVEAQGHFVNAE